MCFQEVVLSSEQDAFFKANMYENFGDIGINIKKMVDDFQQVSKSNQSIQTIGYYSYIFASMIFNLMFCVYTPLTFGSHHAFICID